jgi:heavy metal translocating P-type ATPase
MTEGEHPPKNHLKIVHEMPGRIRVRSPFLGDPFLDTRYLEAFLEAVPGVDRVRLNKPAICLVISYDDAPDTRLRILETLESPPEEIRSKRFDISHPPDLTGTIRVAISLLLAPFLPMRLRTLLTWFTALPILSKGADAILNRGITVEVLDASAIAFTLLRRDYFSSIAITLLLTFGDYLQKLTEYKSNRLLLSLYKQEIEWVWIEVEGVETRMPVNEVKVGDIVVCGHGELIPVDGVVVEGAATVNASSITGEPLPVDAIPGTDVFSGTVIEEGRIKIRAERVGSESTTAKVSQYIEKSLENKSFVQAESETLANRLVPITFGLGLSIFAVTGDVRRASAALTVDYSCALKLCSPVAVKTGMNSAARGGLIIKGASALEAFAKVDTFVFDKTGTLTKGSPEVTDVIAFNGTTDEELLSLAASAEVHYKHPMASAIVAAATARDVPVIEAGECDFIVAHGVSAFVNSHQVLVGNRHFVAEDEGIDCSMSEGRAKALLAEGKSTLYVAKNDQLVGLIAIRDVIRPEAGAALLKLKDLGIKHLVVLTGDQKESARALQRALPITEIHWNLLPEDKAVILERLKAEGRSIAYVGDGVNDAPALIRADVGVSLPSGADLARESARVLMLTEDLMSLPFAREVSRRIMSVVRNNFYMTVGINSMVLLMALTGLVSPLAAALMHNGSTVGLLTYALHATSIRPKATAGTSKALPEGRSHGASADRNGLDMEDPNHAEP